MKYEFAPGLEASKRLLYEAMDLSCASLFVYRASTSWRSYLSFYPLVALEQNENLEILKFIESG